MFKIIGNPDGDERLSVLHKLIKQFVPYSQKKLGFDQPVIINLLADPKNALNPLGKTAHYEPGSKKITLFVTGRHPKDILRSLSHELVHHNQNCKGELANSMNTGPGYAQNDDHLRNMEKQAYLLGNLRFRDWEDGIKLQQQQENRSMSIKNTINEAKKVPLNKRHGGKKMGKLLWNAMKEKAKTQGKKWHQLPVSDETRKAYRDWLAGKPVSQPDAAAQEVSGVPEATIVQLAGKTITQKGFAAIVYKIAQKPDHPKNKLATDIIKYLKKKGAHNMFMKKVGMKEENSFMEHVINKISDVIYEELSDVEEGKKHDCLKEHPNTSHKEWEEKQERLAESDIDWNKKCDHLDCPEDQECKHIKNKKDGRTFKVDCVDKETNENWHKGDKSQLLFEELTRKWTKKR